MPTTSSTASEAETLQQELENGAFTVDSVQEKQRKRQPLPPYITSTLQQDANRRMGYSAKRTMSIAQRLYEGVELGNRGTTALITYMRTDSVRIAKEAQDAAKELILDRFGADYYPPKTRNFKTKGGAQDAHEAIRPVDVTITPESVKPFLPGEQYKLYRLVWQRFVASQMAAATFWDTTVARLGPAHRVARQGRAVCSSRASWPLWTRPSPRTRPSCPSFPRAKSSSSTS